MSIPTVEILHFTTKRNAENEFYEATSVVAATVVPVGALMGFGVLAIFSFGALLLLLGLGLLIPLARGGPAGAWMALVGAATPWAVFAVEGIVSPDCASGSATITPSGEEHFRCDVMNSSTEFVPFLLVSVGVIAMGLVLFFLTRRSSPASSARP